jgi:hypothetical protein
MAAKSYPTRAKKHRGFRQHVQKILRSALSLPTTLHLAAPRARPRPKKAYITLQKETQHLG